MVCTAKSIVDGPGKINGTVFLKSSYICVSSYSSRYLTSQMRTTGIAGPGSWLFLYCSRIDFNCSRVNMSVFLSGCCGVTKRAMPAHEMMCHVIGHPRSWRDRSVRRFDTDSVIDPHLQR